MIHLGLRLITSVALSGAEVMVDATRAVAGDDAIDIRPHQFRRLLLTFEESVQGRIPEILGEDEEERVETLTRLLRGTSEKDLAELIGSLSLALDRLREEEGWDRRRERRAERRERMDERRERLHDRRDRLAERHARAE